MYEVLSRNWSYIPIILTFILIASPSREYGSRTVHSKIIIDLLTPGRCLVECLTRLLSKHPPPMGWFESDILLEFLGFSMWHVLKLVVGDFLWVLQFSPFLPWIMVSANEIKLK